MKPTYPLHLLIALTFAISFSFTSVTHAQVNGIGVSALADFDNVINIPTDPDFVDGASIGGVSGQTTQLNLLSGGSIGSNFVADLGSEVNISGGNVGDNFFAGNSEVNISGGIVASRFTVGNSVVDISGGAIGNPDSVFRALGGSDINISDGIIEGVVTAQQQSTIDISGGSLGDIFNVIAGSTANISGGNFGSFFNVGGGSEVDISGGNFAGNSFGISTEIGIREGTVNISGGEFTGLLSADEESTVNFIGTEFFVDGVRLDPLAIRDPFTINNRDAFLSGTLLDGSDFGFFLGSQAGPDFVSADSIVTVTAVPEPSGLAILLASGVVSLSVRRRR